MLVADQTLNYVGLGLLLTIKMLPPGVTLRKFLAQFSYPKHFYSASALNMKRLSIGMYCNL